MTLLQAPLVAGRYRLGDLLGRGGMADVYRAHDEVLDRTVAVKLLRNAADPMHRARFGAEASTLAGLHHPNIVTLLDAGLDEEVPFLVMDLVAGRTLSDHAAAGPLDRDWVRRIGAQVARALAHAHASGVVHRDVKPSNILIDAEGRAFLTDFGIARLLGSVDRHTRADELVGSPAFLAPEQVEAAELTPAADVYSLGLVLLEVLTGQRAYPGSPVEAAIARLRVAPLIPTSLGPQLCQLLEQMTRLEPEGRPSAMQVARVLEGRSAQEPAGAEATATLALVRPPSAARAPGRTRRRLVVGAFAAAAAVATLVLPLVLTTGADESKATVPVTTKPAETTATRASSTASTGTGPATQAVAANKFPSPKPARPHAHKKTGPAHKKAHPTHRPGRH